VFAVKQVTDMKVDDVPFNWVDLLTAVVLFVGILRGRKRGLSEEFLDTIQWVVIVVLAGLYHSVVARHLSRSSLLAQGVYNVCAYLTIVVTIKLVVAFIKRRIGDKIIGSDVFGRGEYYLGMLAGMVRFACMYCVALSLLHAPYYTEQMLAENEKMQEKNFGDIRFPTLGGLQHTFFKESATGWAANKYLATVLIQPVSPEVGSLRNENSMGRKRERTVDAVLGGK
jgi:uncharacterized membrane protein required for colicin V production